MCSAVVRQIAFLLLIGFGVIAVNAQSLTVFHSRVGDTIDVYERDYFQLFPNIQGFRFAVLDSVTVDSFTIRCAHIKDNETEIAELHLTSQSRGRLYAYLRDIEHIWFGRHVISWPRSDIIDSSYEVSTPRRIYTTLIDGSKHYSRLLVAGPGGIITEPKLMKELQADNFKTCDHYKPNEIMSLQIGSHWKHSRTGMIIGGLVTLPFSILAISQSTSDKDCGMGSVMCNVDPIVGPTILISGVGLGGFIGWLVSQEDPPHILDINGDQTRYTGNLEWIKSNCRFNSPPPELRNHVIP